MRSMTTVKLSVETRNGLKEIAERDGVTLDRAVRRLLRAERQRQIGLDLASAPTDDQDRAWVVASGQAVQRALG